MAYFKSTPLSVLLHFHHFAYSFLCILSHVLFTSFTDLFQNIFFATALAYLVHLGEISLSYRTCSNRKAWSQFLSARKM